MASAQVLSTSRKQEHLEAGKRRKNLVRMSGILALPEVCIANVISFTTPSDACRLACVSTTFRSAADSDVVWDRFLPSDYLSAISDSASSPTSSLLSKKELYLRACHNPLLINEGKLSFWLDKLSGKKCYMISPKELKIIWADTPQYWRWISLPEARFPAVARLKDVFEIGGKINTSLMSPMTTYVAYLVFKLTRKFYGFKNNRVEATVGLAGSNGHKRTVYFHPNQEGIVPGDGDNRGLFPKTRGDMWLESELGEFFYGGTDEEDELSMTILEIRRGNCMEIRRGNWKRGLVVQGIEIRPKNG